jgi:hypothetical protein
LVAESRWFEWQSSRNQREIVINALAIVTGAGSGIGRAVAPGFAARGNRVVAADPDLAAAGWDRTAAASPWPVSGW